jgi:hypothetical protein
MKSVAKVLATSPSLDGITAMINKYWYSTNYHVVPTEIEGQWAVSGMRGRMNGYRVLLQRGRYRFEQLPA